MIEAFEVTAKTLIEIYVALLRRVTSLENYTHYVNNISLRRGGPTGHLPFLDVTHETSI